MTNPFARLHNEKWVYPVSAMSAILGFMMVAAWLTEKNGPGRVQFIAPDQRPRVAENVVDLVRYEELQREVGTLREKATKLEKAISSNSQGSATLNAQLQDLKAVANLTELEGPGVKVTMRDNPKAGPAPMDIDLIHDIDLLRVVNELFASDAEAISVNGKRIHGGTWIRCAGPTILIDGVKVAAPYVISAIGNPETLYNGFTFNGGVMTEITSANESMIQISKEKSMRIPPYLGTTERKFAVVPKVTTK